MAETYAKVKRFVQLADDGQSIDGISKELNKLLNPPKLEDAKRKMLTALENTKLFPAVTLVYSNYASNPKSLTGDDALQSISQLKSRINQLRLEDVNIQNLIDFYHIRHAAFAYPDDLGGKGGALLLADAILNSKEFDPQEFSDYLSKSKASRVDFLKSKLSPP